MSFAYQWVDLQDNLLRTKKLQPAAPQGGKTQGLPAPSVAPAGAPTAPMTGSGWEYGGSDSANGTGGNSPAAPGGGISASDVGRASTALGVAGQLTGTPELGMAGAALGVTAAASQGNWGPAGSVLGGIATNSPIGAVAGGIIGSTLSGQNITGKNVANAVLGAAVPGYGLVNAVSGGRVSSALFGKDISFNREDMSVTPATRGIFGSLGKTEFADNEQGNVTNPSSINAQNGMDVQSDGWSKDQSSPINGLNPGEDAAAQGAVNGSDKQSDTSSPATSTSPAGPANEGGTVGGGGLGPGENASSSDAVNGSDSMSDGYSGDGPGGW